MTRFVFPWQSGSHYKYSTDKVGTVLYFVVFVVLAFAGRPMAFVTSSLNISVQHCLFEILFPAIFVFLAV